MIWKPVIYRGIRLQYEVSNDGTIRAPKRLNIRGDRLPRKVMKQYTTTAGYKGIILVHNRRKINTLVHTLVAFAFLPPPPSEYGRGKIALNHINSIKSDNRASNLEWVSYKANSTHAIVNGLMCYGERNPKSIFKEQEVLEIRQKWKNGQAIRSLARAYACSRCAISSICYRKTWKHI